MSAEILRIPVTTLSEVSGTVLKPKMLLILEKS